LAGIRIGVLVSGRGSNLQALIEASREGRVDAEVVVVISDVEGAPALKKAEEAAIAAHYVDPGPRRAHLTGTAEASIVRLLEESQVDLICLAGFMRILSPGFVRRFARRIMNIHPSLLPAFPGLNVQRKALEYGVKFSGATVHFVDEGVDTGPIIIQAAVPVVEGDTEESLSQRVLKEEHRIYAEAAQLFAEGRLRIDGRVVHVLPERSGDAGSDKR
jgi:phosphoribosylglycinamide formyltransferase-1